MYQELLKEWCDALIELQVTHIDNKHLYGGILCPACGRIHGRCSDAIYPMMVMARLTHEEKYLDCAKRLFAWSENMLQPDGSYYNDTNSGWKGITVFQVIQLGEALYYHGDLLDRQSRELWSKRCVDASDYLFENIEEIGGNINYPIACAAAMAVSHRLFKDDKYGKKAKSLAKKALHYFTEEGLIYGEGKPQDYITPKGCRPVDLGYNVEESLPALVLYAQIEKDEEVLGKVISSMKAHLKFMLPDGAWDNSWGTRNNKWSYWGSRTSDGCQGAYGILMEEEAQFEEAAYRNTILLKKCTKDGLLYGGPMYVSAGQPACIHHTICHAKAIATLIEHQKNPKHLAALPREIEDGITFYPSIHVGLLAKGPWRATITDYDFEYSLEGHATGGALTMLWREETGSILAGTMTHYTQVEPNNMQLPSYVDGICLTPRIELQEGHIKYRSINDLSSHVTYCEEEGKTICRAQGNLCDAKQIANGQYEIVYSFTETTFEIQGHTNVDHAKFYLPIISDSEEEVTYMDQNKISIMRNKGSILIEASATIEATAMSRIFNPVGGFEAVPLQLDLKDKTFWVRIQYMNI